MKKIYSATFLFLICLNPLSGASLSNNATYPYFCQNAANDEELFSGFKRNPIYREILEHLNYDQGLLFVNYINKFYPDLFEKNSRLQTNDKIGNPETFEYEKIGSYSPTTLRYIKVAGDLRKEFGDLSKLNIVEIGAGYGGQCKILSDLFGFASYTIIDLPQCNELTKKYLSRQGVDNVEYISYDKVPSNKKYDLVISNYGFSQCDRAEQQKYLEKIIDTTPKGYITCNFIAKDAFSSQELIKILNTIKKTLIIQPEVPSTGADNLVFIWK